MDAVRIGLVSAINYKNGTVRVTYPDRDDCVTAEIPIFSFTGEYKPPKVGEEVLVLHLSNGEEAGVMLGKYWSGENRPPISGKGFRKELGETVGEAYLQYKNGTLTIHAGTIRLDGSVSCPNPHY